MLKNQAKNKIKLAYEQKETLLALSEYELDSLPSEIETLYWLESLFISFNSIEDISLVKKLPNLKKLDLRGNKVSDISALSELKNLEYLDLDNNYISEIKPICHLEKLQTLYLSNNKIKDISSLSKLQNLINLDLSYNRIENVSFLKNILTLKSLKLQKNNIQDINGLETNINLSYLNISKNQIINLNNLTNHRHLKQLIIGNNKISDLSPISKLLSNGLSINCGSNEEDKPSNNPLTIPPPEIVAHGFKSILHYFDEINRQGSEKLYEAKMLVIGEGGAGKTSLVHKMKNENCSLPKEDETTFGIDISRFPILKMQDGKNFYLNIWDFGGQEIYHSTHQFFLTNRSLYILLDDTRKDDKSVNDSIFSYWLQIVELLGGESPLLIIQNEKGDRSKAIDIKSMQARFSFIKDCKQTNLLTNRGLDNVKDSIKYWIKQLPHVGETLPKQWINIRRQIQELATIKNHITIQEYLKICSANKIPEETRALNLSSYLHDLGVFLHYQDDIVLKNILILNNSWATDAVYAILDDEEIKNKQGFFTNDDLNRLWISEKYKFYHPVLLALMEKFELCYKLQNNNEMETWLAPQLLSISRPTFTWDYTNNIKIRYDYSFMPKGLLSRLIVRLNKYLKDFNFAWRSGIILERSETKALIQEIYASHTILINCFGIFAKDFITIISEELDDLNKTFRFLKVQKLIQCNCKLCLDSDIPHFYDYHNLQNRIINGKQTVECELSYKDVGVKSIIEGVFTNILRKKDEDMKLFISYAHKDENYKDELLKHLKGLKITQNLTTWDDNEILPGFRWDEKIKENMKTADIILLLISSDFIASNYIWEKELPIAIERDKNGDAIVIPIFVRECDTSGLPFMELQGLPKNAKPISKFRNKDEAYTEISKGIRKRINLIEIV